MCCLSLSPQISSSSSSKCSKAPDGKDYTTLLCATPGGLRSVQSEAEWPPCRGKLFQSTVSSFLSLRLWAETKRLAGIWLSSPPWPPPPSPPGHQSVSKPAKKTFESAPGLLSKLKMPGKLHQGVNQRAS